MEQKNPLFELNLMYLFAVRELAKSSFKEAIYLTGLDDDMLNLICECEYEQLKQIASSPKVIFCLNGSKQHFKALIASPDEELQRFAFTFAMPKNSLLVISEI